jgi:hypothetical protein
MRINIPVQNNVEVLIAEVFIKSDVRLHTLMPPRTTEGKFALEEIQNILRAKIYNAIHDALKEIEASQ